MVGQPLYCNVDVTSLLADKFGILLGSEQGIVVGSI